MTGKKRGQVWSRLRQRKKQSDLKDEMKRTCFPKRGVPTGPWQDPFVLNNIYKSYVLLKVEVGFWVGYM